MSIAALIKLSQQPEFLLSPEELERKQADFSARMVEYNKAATQRARNRVVSQEQLNKVCDWHLRNDL
jgi:hypothetical protein